MPETFRPGTLAEIPAVARLIVHSFVGRSPGEFEEHLQDGSWSGVESLWVAAEGGRPVAACQLHPLRQWVGGVALPITGVGTVTVSPTHRRRGLAGRMLEAGLRHARSLGHVGTALYPFRAAYYAQLGYALVGEAHQYRLPPAAFPDSPAERERLQLVTEDEDEFAMKAVYVGGARRETGQLQRSERSWQRVWGSDDRGAVVYYGPDGEPEAYAIVRYRTDLPAAERFLEVEERMWLTPGGRRAVYAWLSSLGDQWREIVYRAHPEERFADQLAEPRLPHGTEPNWGLWYPAATLLRGPMFRLLHVPEALASRTLAPARPLTLRLDVDDRQLPQNRGPWRMRLADGRVEIEPYAAGAVDATLSAGIGALSRLYVGDLTATDAVAAGLVALDRPEVARTLDTALRLPRPWTFDRF